MDAAALLKRQGWRGNGHSLHPTDSSVGLAKPLLFSRNTDGRGIGQKQHFTSDQWWLNAFDQKLKGLDTSGKGVVQSVTNGALDVVASGGGRYTGASGLYASFIRGEVLGGTVTPDSAGEATDATPVSEDRELVPGLRDGVRRETKAERKARKEAKRLRKAAREQRRAEREQRRSSGLAETREERRARRTERRARKEERRKRRRERGARDAAVK